MRAEQGLYYFFPAVEKSCKVQQLKIIDKSF